MSTLLHVSKLESPDCPKLIVLSQSHHPWSNLEVQTKEHKQYHSCNHIFLAKSRDNLFLQLILVSCCLCFSSTSTFIDPQLGSKKKVGKLIYLQTNIWFIISTISQFFEASCHDLWGAILRILWYIMNTLVKGSMVILKL